MDDNFAMGYAMGQDNNCDRNNGNGGLFGNDGWLGILLLIALLGGGFGWGGLGGWGGGGSGGAGLQGMATRADINEGFALNNITSGITAIQQGICDATYALNNTINQGFNSTQMGMMQGFNSVDKGVSTLGYNMQGSFNSLGHQISDCCCQTQRMIERGFCDTNYNLATNANNIMQAGHADTDRIISKLDLMESNRQQEKINALQAEVQWYRFQGSLDQQRAFITANQDAQTAEIFRRMDYRNCNANGTNYMYS